jgi:DNA-binding beta-propeller fold protein YncE
LRRGNVVKVYTTTNTPTLVATIPTGELLYGIWPSRDGTKNYVALKNGTGINVIHTLTNKVKAQDFAAVCRGRLTIAFLLAGALLNQQLKPT